MSALLAVSQPDSHVSLDDAQLALRLNRLRLLRLSVTDLCNLRCRYCMPEKGVTKLSHGSMLSIESLTGMVRWLAAQTGVCRVRITGGEPLVRPGLEDLIRGIASLPQIREVAITTNGMMLAQMAWKLRLAGVRRVNISLDSLDAERFAEITRGGNLKRTLAGIEAAKCAGLTPIKLNAVLQRSTWKTEIPRLLDFAQEHGFEIRFIELMRTGTEREWCNSEFIGVDEVRRELGAEMIAVQEESRSSARRTQLQWRGETMTVGWITPRSHPFCSSCERLRLDARGRVRRCLMDPSTLDLARLLAAGDEVEAKREFCSYMAGKTAPRVMDTASAMSQIGG